MAAAGAIRHEHSPNLVALHEATDLLHWTMHPTLHRHIRMARKITSI
jgi:hypothetical protein